MQLPEADGGVIIDLLTTMHKQNVEYPIKIKNMKLRAKSQKIDISLPSIPSQKIESKKEK